MLYQLPESGTNAPARRASRPCRRTRDERAPRLARPCHRAPLPAGVYTDSGPDAQSTTLTRRRSTAIRLSLARSRRPARSRLECFRCGVSWRRCVSPATTAPSPRARSPPTAPTQTRALLSQRPHPPRRLTFRDGVYAQREMRRAGDRRGSRTSATEPQTYRRISLQGAERFLVFNPERRSGGTERGVLFFHLSAIPQNCFLRPAHRPSMRRSGRPPAQIQSATSTGPLPGGVYTIRGAMSGSDVNNVAFTVQLSP